MQWDTKSKEAVSSYSLPYHAAVTSSCSIHTLYFFKCLCISIITSLSLKQSFQSSLPNPTWYSSMQTCVPLSFYTAVFLTYNFHKLHFQLPLHSKHTPPLHPRRSHFNTQSPRAYYFSLQNLRSPSLLHCSIFNLHSSYATLLDVLVPQTHATSPFATQ